jgi:hypothetical protein
VGSGLILLVIVAAWLAVLVPMALRSHDATDSLSSVERFSDAMRVLSRRDAAAARARAHAVAGPARLGSDVDDDEPEGDDGLEEWDDDGESTLIRVRRAVGAGTGAVVGLVQRVPMPRLRSRGQDGPRRPLTAAARRRRLLLVLLALAAVTLAAGLLVTPWLLGAHAVAVLIVVLFVVHLRRMQLRRAASDRPAVRRPASRPRSAELVGPPAAAPRAGSVRVRPAARRADDAEPGQVARRDDAAHQDASQGDVSQGDASDGDAAHGDAEPQHGGTVPAAAAAGWHDEPQHVPVTTVARYDEPLPTPPSPGLGAPWSPVPVPPPVYASAPMAPRHPRTVDLTRPGAYAESLAAGERLPGMEDEPSEPDRVVEPRRAVNDW